MVQIIPTLFSTTEEEYNKRLSKLTSSTTFKEGWVQLDLMDNKFVPKMGISPDVVKKNPPNFNIEAQLMVVDPKSWFDGLFDLKVKRIIFPLEIDQEKIELIKIVNEKGIEIGLSINPDTKVNKLDQYLEKLDAVLLMAVNPGLENQKFDERTYEKIKYLKQKSPNLKVGVDGGVSDINIKELINAGLDYAAIGSFLFKGNFDENLETLWEVING
jgi:ribulose-phosphate 3-epimerase